MGLYAHSTHIFLPDQDTGRLVATALLKSPLSLVISKPYGKWINAYLPMGVTYKDVKEFPSAACFELNCFDSEGLEIKLFKNDRLAFHFESGVSDAAEQEDQVLEIAEQLWQRENPDLVTQAREAQKKQASNIGSSAEEDAIEGVELTALKDFWSLSEEEQKPFMDRARQSSEFKAFEEKVTATDQLPDFEPLLEFLTTEYSPQDLERFLSLCLQRGSTPEEEASKAFAAKMLNGKEHSTLAEDYLSAFAKLFGLKGCLWTVETLLEQKADKIDRRIIPIDALEA